jgi:hypothetical protein
MGNTVLTVLPLSALAPADHWYLPGFHITVTAKDGADVVSESIVLYAVRVIVL